MKSIGHSGIHLFSKSQGRDTILKEMLQFLKACSPGKSLQFAYVESETGLIPHLSLWENLHIIVGGNNWQEFVAHLEVEWRPLINLIANPHVLASEASSWERLTVGLIKASLISSPHILIDMNEDAHSALNLQNFKNMILLLAEKKNIFIATAKPQVWIDSTQSVISRQGFKFVVEEQQEMPIKLPKIA